MLPRLNKPRRFRPAVFVVALVAVVILWGCRDLHIHIHMPPRQSVITDADDDRTPEEILNESLGMELHYESDP